MKASQQSWCLQKTGSIIEQDIELQPLLWGDAAYLLYGRTVLIAAIGSIWPRIPRGDSNDPHILALFLYDTDRLHCNVELQGNALTTLKLDCNVTSVKSHT
jgi:hypothetical protein